MGVVIIFKYGFLSKTIGPIIFDVIVFNFKSLKLMIFHKKKSFRGLNIRVRYLRLMYNIATTVLHGI